jgi:hypothetical protein
MAQTRRSSRIKHTTRKHPRRGYIYLAARGGLNDNLAQLAICTKYAIKHRRSIIIEFTTYAAANIDTVFDFSEYPVPVFINFKDKVVELSHNPIEPAAITSLKDIPMRFSHDYDKEHGWKDKNGVVLRFDLTRSYPSDTVLVYASGGGGGGDNALEILGRIRLKPAVLAAYHRKIKECEIPAEYVSIHLRASDRKLNITNNITGMRLKNSDAIIKVPSTGNLYRDSLRKIGAFIKAHQPMRVFVAGDNSKLIAKLEDRYPSVIMGSGHSSKRSGSGPLHKEGASDPNNLRDSIVDLLILAGGNAIMTSQGGYSRLAKKLLGRQDILEKLLA